MGNKSKKRAKQEKAKIGHYGAKVFYASPTDLFTRIPELKPLREKTVAMFGLGCLGAPSVLEFARAGVECIRLVDFDVVDPATGIRWPLGFSATGEKKVTVLQEFINKNYPYTKCGSSDVFEFKVGAVRSIDLKKSLPMAQETIEKIVTGADLIYDSTAEWGVQHYLTDHASGCQIPYIGLSGTWGAWGGRVVRIVPNRTGCWSCYRLACKEGIIPEPPCAPDEEGKGLVQPTGCADPTFTGAGFDMLQVALMGVKMAVSLMCEGITGAYPSFDWDAVHVGLRSENGSLIAPKFDTYKIDPNPECPHCHGKTHQ